MSGCVLQRRQRGGPGLADGRCHSLLQAQEAGPHRPVVFFLCAVGTTCLPHPVPPCLFVCLFFVGGGGCFSQPPTLLTPSQIKPEMVGIETELFYYLGRTRLTCTYVLGRCVASTVFHTRTFGRALTASLDSSVEIKSAVSVA